MALEATARRPLPPRRLSPDRIPGANPAPVPVGDNAVIVRRIGLSPFVAQFRIRADAPLSHVEPGQYLSLGLVVDGQLLQRPYSTATPAGIHDELEFLIRLVPNGAFTPRLWRLGVGDRLRVGRPKGLFTRIAGDRRTHVLIATGTGLAPFVAMLETMLREPEAPRVVVIHGVAHAVELAYRERLERWAAEGRISYVPSISRPADPSNHGWTGRAGRIDAILDDVLVEHALDSRHTVAYLCGNPAMIAAGARILAAHGLSADAIRSEHYWPA